MKFFILFGMLASVQTLPAMAQVAENALPYVETISTTNDAVSHSDGCYLTTEVKTRFSVKMNSQTLKWLGHDGEFRLDESLLSETRSIAYRQCQQLQQQTQQVQQSQHERQIQQGSLEWNLGVLKAQKYQISLATTEIDARLAKYLSPEFMAAKKLEIRGYEWVNDLIEQIRKVRQNQVLLYMREGSIIAGVNGLYCILNYEVLGPASSPTAACYLLIP